MVRIPGFQFPGFQFPGFQFPGFQFHGFQQLLAYKMNSMCFTLRVLLCFCSDQFFYYVVYFVEIICRTLCLSIVSTNMLKLMNC